MSRYGILLLAMAVASCSLKQENAEDFVCTEGTMKRAWYEHGVNESVPAIKGLTKGFQILVDTSCKATDFVSFGEQYSRDRSVHLDTSDLQWQDDWNKLTVDQKLKLLKKERDVYRRDADSSHLLNNRGQQQVWLINNSDDTVALTIQDWSYICVLQAKAKSGKWYAIQYWKFSTCGNSYLYRYLPPKMANSFIANVPMEGNFATKLRYKLLGKNVFYYSNEFDGKIDLCQFVEESNRNKDGTKTMPHFKLDSMVHLPIL